MVGNSTVSLVVGFPTAQKPNALGALHRQFKVKQSEKLDIINGFTVDVPAKQVDAYVKSLPSEATVMVNDPFFSRPVTDRRSSQERGRDFSDMESAQPTPAPYISRPDGLQELHSAGFEGQGVTIAVVDSGIAPHTDFQDRVKFFKDFSTRSNKNIDPFGHGTHVTGIAAGDGAQVDGIAPKADLVGLRIQSPKEAIQAIQWAVENKDKYSIDVLNLSLGVEARLPNRQDPFAQAAQQAINAGIITVIASGNECSADKCSGTISTPGTLPDAITVGAFDDRGTGALDDDVIWGRSSNGPTPIDGLAKPDLVAPGVNVYAPSSKGSDLGKNRPNWENYHSDLGSSMATPMVSGAAALLLQVDPSLNQSRMKELLASTAIPLSATPKDAQGAGRLNLLEAMKKAGAKVAG